MTRLGVVPIVRPLFRGARLGLWERSRDALESLAADLDVVLAYVAPPVTEPDEAQLRAAEAAGQDLDLLLVQHVTFGTGDLLVPFLELQMPVALWALPEATPAGPLPQNALCGLNLALSLPVRRHLPVKWLYGWADDPELVHGLRVTVRALRARRALLRGRLLWIGGAAPGFYRLDTPVELPVRIDTAPLDVLFEAMSTVSNADVDAALSSVDEPSDLTFSDLRAAVRVELALDRLARGYDGIALRCWPELPDRAGAMPCAAFARLGDRGVPAACEGDAAGLASMLALAAVTGRPAVLLDLSHVADDALLFWHCGNAPRAWASGTTRLAPHFNRGLAAVRQMRLAPGPVSGIRFLEGRTAAVYAGTVTERADGYDGVWGWIGDLRWAGKAQTAREFLACVLNQRLPHHFAWGSGDVETALLELCAWLGLRVLEPDPRPRVVRWPA